MTIQLKVVYVVAETKSYILRGERRLRTINHALERPTRGDGELAVVYDEDGTVVAWDISTAGQPPDGTSRRARAFGSAIAQDRVDRHPRQDGLRRLRDGKTEITSLKIDEQETYITESAPTEILAMRSFALQPDGRYARPKEKNISTPILLGSAALTIYQHLNWIALYYIIINFIM